MSTIAQSQVLCLIIFSVLRITYSEVNLDQEPNSNDIDSFEVTDEEDGKIIGGEIISIDRVPFLVSLQYSPFGDFYSHRCGGTLVAPKFVLTAAHCMIHVTEPKQLRIRAGSSRQTEGGQVKVVVNYHIHPDYVAQTFTNDITVLELQSRIWTSEPNTFIGKLISRFTWWFAPKSPRTAALSRLARSEIPENAKFYTAGWGTTDRSGLAVDTLFGLAVPFINQTACREMYSAAKVKDTMMCAGYSEGGRDTCQGDSGGPLIYYNELIGIVSWGDGCAKANKPGVYTRVSSFLDFINLYVQYD